MGFSTKKETLAMEIIRTRNLIVKAVGRDYLGSLITRIITLCTLFPSPSDNTLKSLMNYHVVIEKTVLFIKETTMRHP